MPAYRRAATGVLAVTLVVLAASGARAQSGPPRPHDQLPRFLRMPADPSRKPAVIDPADDSILSRRIAVRLRDVTYRAALHEIGLSAGVRFVYAGDLLSRYDAVSVQSYNITVARALTEVLRGAGVDVAVGTNGTLILLRQPSRDSLDAVAAGDSVARVPERGVLMAPVVTVGIAESRRIFEMQPMMGTVEIGVKELAAAPAPFGGDLFRTLQLLPGVEAKNDYAAGLNVRGGESDQNLILLDGYPVYNPFHLGGLLGTFMDPMVSRVELLVGAQPVQYGERLSSVLDVRSAEAERPGVHGTADVSLLAATATIGSAFDDGGSWMLGGRHTYADVIANLVKRNSLPYGFSDAQGHLSRPVFGGAVLSVTGYGGSDGAVVNQNGGGVNVSWGNQLIGATLSKLIPERKVVFGRFAVDSIALVQRASLTTFSATAAMPARLFDLADNVRDLRASGSATLFTAAVDHSIGYEISAQHTAYSMHAPITSITNFLPQAALNQSLTPVSAWYDALWRASSRLIVDGGARVDAVSGTGWAGLSPRLSVKYFLTENVALVAATGSYAQWLHSLLQEDAPVQPLEFWIASSRALPVSRSWQSSLGTEAWTSPTRQLRVEAFYKKYSNLPETNPVADANAGDNPFVELTGTSYGADALLRQLDTGRFGWWIAYSYTVSTRVTPAGVAFSPGQDRRHELNAVGNWKFNRYTLSTRFGISTGTPYTPVVGEFTRERYDPLGNGYAPDVGGGDVQYLSGPTNSARLPLANRLDLSISRAGNGKRVQFSPYLSIANVYGANNPAFYVYDYNHTQNGGTPKQVVAPQRTSVGNLPFLPTIGVHVVY